jgi:hypothetical protein
MRHARRLVFLLLLALVFPPHSLHGADPAEAKAPDPLLVTLNGAFRAAYARTRKEQVAATDPILLEAAGRLMLVHNGKRTEVDYMPKQYHELKAVSHIPLALHVMLLGKSDLDDDQLAALAAYRAKVVAAEKTLKERGFEPALLEKLEKMIADSVAFLDRVYKDRKVAAEALTAFSREMGKQQEPLITTAAQVQLDALDGQVKKFRKELTDDEWKRLKVVVVGSAMPRKEHLAVQYFARLLGVPGEGPRIIYAEGLWDDDKALALLGTHVLDGQIGAAFFNDDRRMMRDLLGDAAREYLDRRGR